MKQVVFPLRVFFFIFFLSSCVSFNVDSLKDQTARGVIFQAPPKPYRKIVKKGMDFAWENSENGHTISFFSNCSSSTQFTSIEQFQKELLEELKTFRILSQNEIRHQNQKARRLHLEQKSFEKKKMNIKLLLFKKEDCFYTLSFLTSSSSQKDTLDHQQEFENFIEEFRAP